MTEGFVLTARHRRILEALRDLIAARGYSPSARELVEAAGLRSTSTIMMHLANLRHAGYVTYLDGQARTVRLGPAAQMMFATESLDTMNEALRRAGMRRSA